MLDPRITANLPLSTPRAAASCSSYVETEAWRAFLDGIFYVGKGTRARPLAHLYEAVKRAQRGRRRRDCDSGSGCCPKTRAILDIWEADRGVVCLQVFCNSFQAEAHTREAAMIDAIGEGGGGKKCEVAAFADFCCILVTLLNFCDFCD